MVDESQKKIAIECLIAICIGLFAAGIVSHAGATSLSEGTYAQALRLMQGAPQGVSEIAARALFAAISPIMGWRLDAPGLIKFYLDAPLLLMIMASGLAYAALRLWRFGRVESAGAALLLMLATPIAFAFYPGLWMPETVAIVAALLGLVGLAEASREKDSAIIASIVALVGFGAAVWMVPWMMALPISILVGELILHHRNWAALTRTPGWLIRLAVLVVPVLLAFTMSGPAFTLSISGTMAFLYEARFAIGLALVALPALFVLDKHPLAPMVAGAAASAIAFGTISPAAAMLGLLFPIAYGIKTLGLIGDHPMLYKSIILGGALMFAAVGLFSQTGDGVGILGLAIMTALAGAAIAHVYGWPSGLLRLGLLCFLLCGAILVGVQDAPGLVSTVPQPYTYHALPPGVQDALHWIGLNHDVAVQPRVAVLAPSAAVQLLAGGVQATDNSTWIRYLAGNGNSSPLKKGDYVVAYPELLSQIQSSDLTLAKPWTLVTFQYLGIDTATSTPIAVFVSNNGLALQQTILDNNTLSSDKPQLHTGQFAAALYAGDTQLLLPNQSYRAPGNLLLWYKDNYDANVLRLFRDNGSLYQTLYTNGTVQTEQVMG